VSIYHGEHHLFERYQSEEARVIPVLDIIAMQTRGYRWRRSEGARKPALLNGFLARNLDEDSVFIPVTGS
jgi:hypothetical protein